MAWRIHSWCGETATGAVVSPHFGPLAFAAAENPESTADFVVGEDVVVEVDGPSERLVVRSVRRANRRAPMPAGTACPAFAAMGTARPGDLRVEEYESETLRLWAGDCCPWCGPSWSIAFGGVCDVRGLDEWDGDDPEFRYATDAEIAAHGLAIRDGVRAYRVMLCHRADEPPGEDIFVVAASVQVTPVPIAR